MGKISIASAKYIVHASIEIKGAVDKPDIIGAIFGQTEGLLGSDLELRELQKSGRIGRIEVNSETKGGFTKGSIIIPSSLDKSETSIVGAALEVIQRIGPCESKIKVERIEDVRISKRDFVVNRAKQLLKKLSEEVLPDSKELADAVSESVRVMEIQEYGRDRLPAGPEVEESEEVIVVEGRADVLNLLKYGIKNVVAMNGTSVPKTVIELSKRKVLTAFVDGDRGGDLILNELGSVGEIDFVAKAPTGKEVEELTKKEVVTALRAKKEFNASDVKLDNGDGKEVKSKPKSEPSSSKQPEQESSREVPKESPRDLRNNDRKPIFRKKEESKPLGKDISSEERESYRSILEDLVGTRAAVVIGDNFKIIGKVPVSEASSALKNVSGVSAVVLDGDIDQELVSVADRKNIRCLIGMGKKFKTPGKTQILTVEDLWLFFCFLFLFLIFNVYLFWDNIISFLG